jgi:hypothetical protein
MCAKFGSDRFRNVDLYKVQTNIQKNKQTFIFVYKIRILCIKLEINQGYTTMHGQDTETCRGRVIPLCITIYNQENLLIKKKPTIQCEYMNVL